MAIQIKSDGTFSIEYEGPYAGLDVQKPETLISDKASPALNNFMLRNAEIRSRPNFILSIPGPSGAGPIAGVATFIDVNGIFHTVTWDQTTMWQYNAASSPPWDALGGIGPLYPGPLSHATFVNEIFWTTIVNVTSIGTSLPRVGFWDGITAGPTVTQSYGDGSTANSAVGISLTNSPTVGGSLPGAPTIVGPIAIGARYIGELNSQLLLANVAIFDQGTGTHYQYANLLWWSASGLPLQFDPTVNTSAGENPFLDVPDQITGLVTLGVAGYLFRTNGITQITPIGSAITPFEFDHLWASDHGIGNVFPWSIAQYGPTAAFIATDNIYSLSITNAQPIGGTARDAIFTDLAATTGTPIAAIIPQLKNGYVYLTYLLEIPLTGFVKQWVYSFEDKNWAPWTMSAVLAVTGTPNIV